jgi:hypothetical protein
MDNPAADSALKLLIGKPLDSVSFVTNYVTFDFAGFNLAALAEPVLCNSQERISSRDPSFKDKLVAFIGTTVQSAHETPELVTVGLDNGFVIEIPLNAAATSGPEMATLSGNGRFIYARLRPN